MNNSSGLRVEGLRIDYDGTTLLPASHLTVGPTDIVALLGPSGSGKSSLLRCIAGVQAPDAGRILWDDEDITATPAHRRRIGLVFQDPLLFPHRDVGGNISFGLEHSGMPAKARQRRTADLLDLVGLPGFGQRDVATLSGGEAQRVALARALAPAPRLLLLDEPFGALDRDLRDRLAVDVRDLLHAQGIPAVHVTHDRAEADLVADRVLTLADLASSP